MYLCTDRMQDIKVPGKRKKVSRPVFMFTLRVADNSGETDVLCYDNEAEYMLGGITAEDFLNQEKIRSTIENTFTECINSNISMDFNLWSYRMLQNHNNQRGKAK